jgi:hypothetical protein
MQKYTINQYSVQSLLTWVIDGEIAIPEIQRPFVWKSSKVRDLIDSLYQGYPVGYIISWKNPNVKLKDGTTSEGKKILIDGQQRITALTAGLLGQYVLNDEYKKVKIQIAFNPQTEEFATQTPAIIKDSSWIPDISEIFKNNISLIALVRNYLSQNPEVDEVKIEKSLTNLTNLTQKQIGIIELVSDLDIETVTEIFIRINSAGVVLSQADFAMSKIATNTKYDGINLRKAIDYFCHIFKYSDYLQHILDNDFEFIETEYLSKLTWLKNANQDLYSPDYNDVLRVAFTVSFNRGKIADLVSLLSGRNFETRTFEEEIAEKSFEKLKEGVLQFINQTNFERFVMILKSAGFIDSKMMRSQNAVNFAYILYLKLIQTKENSTKIESYVRRWFVYSILTGRYSGSPESMFDFDIKQIEKRGIKNYLQEKENGELSEAFWSAELISKLNTSVASSPYFHIFIASQVKNRDKGFLSKDLLVADMITHRGDIHHIFPKNYLQKTGFDNRGDYNQIANYVYAQTEINIKLSNKSPREYFDSIKTQIQDKTNLITGIQDQTELEQNLKQNAVLFDLVNMTAENYQDFLEARRALIAEKIRDYYFGL